MMVCTEAAGTLGVQNGLEQTHNEQRAPKWARKGMDRVGWHDLPRKGSECRNGTNQARNMLGPFHPFRALTNPCESVSVRSRVSAFGSILNPLDRSGTGCVHIVNFCPPPVPGTIIQGYQLEYDYLDFEGPTGEDAIIWI